jgi:hypothetical protein
MKILISTGIYPPDLGGPAMYAKNLLDELKGRGFETDIIVYRFERNLPPVVSHLFFFVRVFWKLLFCDTAIILDTLSVG